MRNFPPPLSSTYSILFDIPLQNAGVMKMALCTAAPQERVGLKAVSATSLDELQDQK